MGLNYGGNTQPTNVSPVSQNDGFGLNLLGFGTASTQPTLQQPVQNNGGLNLLGNDFLGLGGSAPSTQAVNNNLSQQPQNNGFNFNQGGFGWGNNQAQQNQFGVNQPQVNQTQVNQTTVNLVQNPNKFVAF